LSSSTFLIVSYTETHDPDAFGRHLHSDRRIRDGVQSRIIGAEAAVYDFYPVAFVGNNDLPVEVRVCGTRRLHRVTDGHTEEGSEGRLTSVDLLDVSLEDHRAFKNPPSRDDAYVRLEVFNFRVLVDFL
jgi:hypothetical protein